MESSLQELSSGGVLNFLPSNSNSTKDRIRIPETIFSDTGIWNLKYTSLTEIKCQWKNNGWKFSVQEA